MINIREGDACTKYFHQRANGRRKRNLIAYLKTETGGILWSHDEKEAIPYNFYRDLLGTNVNRAQVLDWSILNLCRLEDDEMDRPFTEEEIEQTIRLLPAEKAPGPDGFTGTFYKRCWQIIKKDVMDAVNCFYHLQAGPLEHLNGANIVLIPKLQVSEYAKDFRPVSLSAFIKGRCIHDNYMYVRNLARAYHRTKTAALLFKLDISKAFDTVSWEYMFEMLEHRGFSTRWRDWLALLFRTSHSKVLMNGTAGRTIKHARGLRQGDPLSPYLFILAIDALQKVLDLAIEDGVLSPVRGRSAK
jgi:hypothetical protein